MPVNIKTIGHIPEGSPRVAISSPTEIIAALAAAKEEYIYDEPRERNGVEYPRLRYPEKYQRSEEVKIHLETYIKEAIHRKVEFKVEGNGAYAVPIRVRNLLSQLCQRIYQMQVIFFLGPQR